MYPEVHTLLLNSYVENDPKVCACLYFLVTGIASVCYQASFCGVRYWTWGLVQVSRTLSTDLRPQSLCIYFCVFVMYASTCVSAAQRSKVSRTLELEL